jgi:hypothetical protein
MDDSLATLTPMDVARYYMSRLAMRVDSEHYQELCRTVAYAIDPADTAYEMVRDYGLTELPSPEAIFRAGVLPSPSTPRHH